MSGTVKTAIGIGIGAFVLALIVRLIGVTGRDAWLDEVYTQFAVSRDWYGLAADRISRGHSPLYFAIVKATGLPVENIAALRSVTAMLDALACAVLAAALSLNFGRRAAVVFALLYAFSPMAIYWSQNARPYGLLTLALAIGLGGAMGVFAQGPGAQGRPASISRRFFATGFSVASLTMTAGIIAFVCTAVTPYLFKGFRADRALRTYWRRLLVVPGAFAVFGYLLVSGHVARQVDGYWAEKYNPLGFESLWNIWRSMVTGQDTGASGSLPGLHWAPSLALVVALALLLVLGAVVAARRAASQPALIPLIGLATGYVAVLILVSIWTSVLVSRYFLPGWMAFLALASVGLAMLSRRRVNMAVIVPLIALHSAFGLMKSLDAELPRDRSMALAGQLITAAAGPEFTVYFDNDIENIRNDLIIEIFSLRLDDPALRRPRMRGLDTDRMQADIRDGTTIFAVGRPEAVQDAMGSIQPDPTCIHRIDPYLMAYWGAKVGASCKDLGLSESQASSPAR